MKGKLMACTVMIAAITLSNIPTGRAKTSDSLARLDSQINKLIYASEFVNIGRTLDEDQINKSKAEIIQEREGYITIINSLLILLLLTSLGLLGIGYRSNRKSKTLTLQQQVSLLEKIWLINPSSYID
jgi:hypothetical protein